MPVALTHTVTHTGKRADGTHGAKSFRPLPFWGKNARKPLCRNGWIAFYHLVRMRSAVRIRPAAPRYKETPPCRVVFLFSLKRMPCRSRASSQTVEKATGFFRQPEEHHPNGWCSFLWSGGSFVPPTHGNLSFIPQPASGRPAWRAGPGRAEAPRLRPRRY